MKIVFMGTPEFAVASLAAIITAGIEVAAVVTAADKPAGRGQKLNESAVKKFAIENNIPVLQPLKLRDEHFLEELRGFDADLFVVVAFRMLPTIIWKMPKQGTINLHGSLLPQYRGAAPINHAIINGELESGVTTFFIKEEIDTGDIIFKSSVSISDEETAGDLHDKLMQEGANLLVKTIKAVENEDINEQPQQISELLKFAPKIFKEDCKINWNDSCKNVYNFIRGLSPYPTAVTQLNGKILKVFKSAIESTSPAEEAGAFKTDGKTFLKFATQDGYVHLLDLQYEGKKRMQVDDFLRGVRL
ncbi:methionyl-tRNA formyltransferase [Pedobacter sp. UYEF25]